MGQLSINRALLNEFAPRVSPEAIVLYLILADRAEEDRTLEMSVKDMCNALGKSESYVKKYLSEMAREGMIERERRQAADGGNLSNKYTLLI